MTIEERLEALYAELPELECKGLCTDSCGAISMGLHEARRLERASGAPLRLMSDLVPALLAARDGVLKNFDLQWYPEAALTVVMAAKGYPGDYAKGSVIEGLDDAAGVEGVEIFHAGTKSDHGRILANGGRVLNVSAIGGSVSEAQRRAYAAVDKIHWPEGFCRRDIGRQAIEREAAGK